MRQFMIGIGCAIALIAATAAAQEQPTKTVSGTISAIAADSVTVKAGDKEMTFAIDAKTQVIAPGGSTKSREAKAEGKGTAIADVLKTGQAVEVRYHEQGMHAAQIRAIAQVPAAAGPKAQTATGVVSAIGGSSLTVKGSSAEWTFAVDGETTVIGTGVGTAKKQLVSEGKKPTLINLLQEGDTVSVTYHDMGGTKHASEVRITKRKS